LKIISTKIDKKLKTYYNKFKRINFYIPIEINKTIKMTDQKSLDDLMAEFSALENSVPTKKTPTTSPDKKIDVKKKDTETDDLLAEFAALEDSIKKQDAKPKV